MKDTYDRMSKAEQRKIAKLAKEYQKNCKEFGEDDSDTIQDIISIIKPKALAFSRDLLKEDGVPAHGEGWGFRSSFMTENDSDIEVMLYRRGKGFIPSVRCDAWDATASSIGSDIGVKPVAALAWGLSEAFAYTLASK